MRFEKKAYKQWFQTAMEILRYPALRVALVVFVIPLELVISCVAVMCKGLLELMVGAGGHIKTTLYAAWHWDDDGSEVE